nr:putative ribonuclease H-like domain-containing protein [Tanacetum cinerariifolium]
MAVIKSLSLEQESVKKLKTSEEVAEEAKTPDEVDKEKVKEMMQLVPIEEVYVEALQVKHPVIDWKVHTEGQRAYWKITRLGGSSASYQFFVDLLKHLDREDLNQLWVLVKESLNNRPPTSDKEIELWVELKRLYEPDDEDQLWTHTQNLMHAPVEWKLYDTCGVHHVTAKDKEIFMLAEKDYPLRKGLAIGMISYKLQGRIIGNKMHKAFPLPVIEFPLVEEVPTASEESSHCQKKKDATAKRIALLSKSQGITVSQSHIYAVQRQWLMHTIVWRNRSDLDTMNLYDLNNHLKVYESKVQKKSEPNSQNMAFISSAKHSRGNEDVNTASVSTASTNVPTASANIGELKTLKKEKEGLDGKLVGFLTALKDLDNLIKSQRLDKNKDGIGYSAVPPPPTQIYSSPKKDLSWTGLSSLLMIRTITPKPFIKFVKPNDSPSKGKTDKVKTSKKPLVKYAKQYRKLNKKSNKGEKGTSRSQDNTHKRFTHRLVIYRPYRPPVRPMRSTMNDGCSKNSIDDKGYWDSGCSRHMTGNISYLSDYEPFDGGYVSFGQGRCKITGKGIIKTGKQHKASCKSKLLNSVSKPLHTLHMDLFSPTSDETSGILKKFITEIENLKDLKVKISRCDNRGEFRNKEMNDFCSQKGIKKEFSNARTPQQNGVTERRNRTLIEAARTMVLVNKSQNKTLYELFNGRTPAIGFLKPFCCHVMILNTLDNLGKFEAKGDEEFLENKAIEKGAGPNWFFDINSLTKSINYVPVDAGTNSTNLSGTKDAARQEVKNDVSSLRYIALPNWVHDALLESSLSKPQDDCRTNVPKSSINFNPTATSTNPPAYQLETLTVETPIPTVSLPVPTACFTDFPEPSSDARLISKRVANQVETPSLDNILTLANRFEDILRVTTNSDESNGVEADVSNMETTITASHTPTLRIHKDHHKSQIIGPVDTLIQTRNKSKEAMQEELLQFKIQNVWTLIDCPTRMDVKSAFLYGTIDEKVYVMQPPGFQDPEFPAKVYKVEKAMYGLRQAPRAWYGTLSKYLLTNGFQIDIMFAVCACARHQVTPKECHLHAVKRIFKYLKGHPKLGIWCLKESPFDLVAYSDIDYGGATQDRKSTTGGCQFLGRRLISWKCKKQTIVATSTTEVEYVAAASYRGQVLWIQNQLLDYGYNFMNTKIYIDNNSAICIVKTPVYHSKTKHIEIRHNFIRDCFEKKLISMDHIHTDKNITDLLIKPFDAGRFQYLVRKLFPLLVKLSTVSVFLGFGLTFEGTSMCWGILRILMISLRLIPLSEHNVDFHPIVDFVEASPLRRNLKLQDEEGISSLPDTELFENLTLMGYNISPNQKFTFKKGQFSHQWKYIIHTIMQCLSPKSIGFNEFSSNIATALVCLATNRTYNFSKMIFDGMVKNFNNKVSKFLMYPSPSFSGRLVPLFDTMLVPQGEGSGTPSEPHHTPSPEAQHTSYTDHTSSTLPPITTTPIPTVTLSESPTLRQYTRRARIAQSFPLPPVADEPASPFRDVSKGEACPTDSSFGADQDRANISKTSTLPYDSAPRVTSPAATKGKINWLKARFKLLEDREGVDAERSKDDALIKGRNLDKGEAAAKRASHDSEEMATILTSMDAVTVLASGVAEVPISSGSIPTAGPPAAKVPTGSDVVPNAGPIFSTATMVTPYTRKKGKETLLEEEMERDAQRINEQIARDAEIARIHAEEELQSMIDGLDRSNETLEDFIPMGSKEEAERLKKKGLRLEQESMKKLKTSKEVAQEAKSPEEVPEEKVKEMMQLVPIEEVYVEALQVKHLIIDWKVHTEGQRAYWKITRLGGSSASYQFFVDLLKHLDREDLNQLWVLVKESLSNRPPTSDKEMELWLYDTCGVHHVTAKDKEIFMLVKKDYPLRKGLAIGMISYKLQVENFSRTENDLILKIYKIASTSRQQDLQRLNSAESLLLHKEMSQSNRPSVPISEDWASDSEDESEGEAMPIQKESSFVQTFEHVKTPKTSVKPDCDYYEKKMVQKPVWNHAISVNHQNSARMTHPHSKKHVVPTTVLTRSRFIPLNAARPVTTAVP